MVAESFKRFLLDLFFLFPYLSCILRYTKISFQMCGQVSGLHDVLISKIYHGKHFLEKKRHLK